jgi:hypothetical protein
MCIKSITNIQANANSGAWKPLTVNCGAGEIMYLFGDTTFRVRAAGGAATDWIPCANTVAPQPLCLGMGVMGSQHEILSNSASAVDVKIVISDYPIF